MTVGELAQALAGYDQTLDVVSIVPDSGDELQLVDYCTRVVSLTADNHDGTFHESTDGQKYLFIG